jgi:hypothetical protein
MAKALIKRKQLLVQVEENHLLVQFHLLAIHLAQHQPIEDLILQR